MTSHFLYDQQIPERVVLFGDPKRADIIEREVDEFEELFSNREFRGVNVKKRGREALLLSTGIGGPSTAIAMEEARMLGGKEFIRVGTCGVIDKSLNVGQIIVSLAAIKEDGLSNTICPPQVPAVASFSLTTQLMATLEKEKVKFKAGIVRTHDDFYESEEEFVEKMRGYQPYVVASEMEMAVVFSSGLKHGVRCAGLLVANTPEYIDWDKNEVESDISYLSQSEEVREGLKQGLLASITC